VRGKLYDLASYGEGPVNLGVLSDVRSADAAVVSATFFPLLRLKVAHGRALVAADEAPVRRHNVVISDDLWRSVFSGVPEIIGAQLRAQDQTYTIVGVMPSGFRFPGRTDLWFPREVDSKVADTTGLPRPRILIGRLRDGFSLRQAQEEWNVLFSNNTRQLRTYQARMGDTIVVRRWRDVLLRDFSPTMNACLIAACVLWLAVCFSGSLLFVVRSMRAASNVAVKMALGATRARVLVESVREIVVLVVTSSALALLLAYGFIEYLWRFGTLALSGSIDFQIAWHVAALVVLLSALASTAAYTLIIALRLVGSKAATSMSGVTTATGHRQGTRWLALLVSLQMAAAVVLLSAAETASEAIIENGKEKLGFVPEKTLAFSYSLPLVRYGAGNGDRTVSLAKEIVGQIRTIPGVTWVGGGSALREWGSCRRGRLNRAGQGLTHYLLVDRSVDVPLLALTCAVVLSGCLTLCACQVIAFISNGSMRSLQSESL
jgi:putative ABC transport system permease protein